jgi:starch synthase
MTVPRKILFMAAEADPFVKIGGLADVAGSLPLALRDLPADNSEGNHLDVRLVLPFHRGLRLGSAGLQLVSEFPVACRTGELFARVFETTLKGMPVYLIDGPPISGAASVYSLDPAPDREKYTFFSLAALEFLRREDWIPDIIHANDWHTALALHALHSFRKDSALGQVHSVLTLHNLPYSGGDGTDVLDAYGLSPSSDSALPLWARTQLLPLGLSAADMVVAVSPGYAGEILTPDFGCGLDGYLKSRSGSVTGILNGLDTKAWDPDTDKALAENFNVAELAKRAANKAALQMQVGLKVEPTVPLLAMIGRLDPQKGVDIAIETLRLLIGDVWQFIILGSGLPTLEEAVRNLQTEFPDRIRAEIRYDPRLSRMIYAGADMLLMPSRYEPCGLAQMIAMRYGCVPVVRATGGLKDTVQENRTGFLFTDAESRSMAGAIQRAFSVYMDPGKWQNFQMHGMQEDFSWPRSAHLYENLYKSFLSG